MAPAGSRFGPLMIAAGFANFLASLSWARTTSSFTIGQALDLLPAALFLHVFLAFPSGRLRGRFERALVAGGVRHRDRARARRACRSAASGPHNLLEVSPNLELAVVTLRRPARSRSARSA